MAKLDVSDALLDPELIDMSLVVYRRSESVPAATGIAVLTTTTFRNVVGVVCVADKSALELGSDESHQDKSYSIVARFPLRGVAPGMQPDLVLFRGSLFKVVKVEDYSSYGPGFVQAVASAIDAADLGPATLPPSMGEMIFATEVNSGLIPAL